MGICHAKAKCTPLVSTLNMIRKSWSEVTLNEKWIACTVVDDVASCFLGQQTKVLSPKLREKNVL